MSKEIKLIFTSVYILVAIGIIMIYSASAVFADQLYRNSQYYLLRQIVFTAIGTVVLFFTANVPVSFWRKNSRALMLLSIVFLVMVFLPIIGRAAGGAQRWISFGLFNFQPAEFAKIAVCLYLADYLSRKKKDIAKGDIRIFIPPLILVGVTCALILMQPDLGSCVFIFAIVSVLFFWAGIRMRYVLVTALFILPVLYFLVIRVPYRLSRVTAYLNPWDDPQGGGFQIIQSFLAFGLGGVQGVGLGQSMQKLFYLPSSYNDFIFSVISEELGLIGAIFVIFLYLIIFVCGIHMAETADQDYNRLLIVSLTLLIVLQAIIHMLVTTGLVPTKGLPLPFVSYGGTSIVFNLMAVGLLMGVDRYRRAGIKTA